MCYIGVHIGATWRIGLNRLCVVVMRPFCQITLTIGYYPHIHTGSLFKKHISFMVIMVIDMFPNAILRKPIGTARVSVEFFLCS